MEHTNLMNADLIPSLKGPPHALFAKWREEDPVHWNPPPEPGSYESSQPGSTVRKGFWVLTRYDDVSAASRDQKLFSSYEGGPIIWDFEGPYLERQRASLMGMHSDRHMQFKRLIVPAFAPRVLAAFEPLVETVAREIIDDIAARGECEFIMEVASRLPVYTFCKILGVPDEDRNLIFRLGNALADVEGHGGDQEPVLAELFLYANQLAERKRLAPDNSMMSMAVNGTVDGDRLADDEVAMFFVVMSIAGHETTRSTAAHFIRLMNEHPDQYTLVVADPDKYLPNAIDEVLRHAPPVIQFRRTATADTELGGHPIAKGDKVYLSYPAANRDPAIFEDPERFDILRANAGRHLSFGIGPHICLGARLAKTQLFHLLKQIVTRIPDIRMSGENEYLRSVWFNAIMKMPVRFEPEKV